MHRFCCPNNNLLPLNHYTLSFLLLCSTHDNSLIPSEIQVVSSFSAWGLQTSLTLSTFFTFIFCIASFSLVKVKVNIPWIWSWVAYDEGQHHGEQENLHVFLLELKSPCTLR
eukprot:TRINITY_DN8545_c0_g1_i1.p1 TRINITY_DN8545_c0_g1~~TRINITY_DN8545_c0_g1_i1.p1  ORF type:complete len:112 (-),score=4.50 TRINITY_DN8545_c0_g1_i1:12-347(-)